MIVTFNIGAYTFVDSEAVPQHDIAITDALLVGLRLVPPADRCSARGLRPGGEYPPIRLGVFDAAGALVGAWWAGCFRRDPPSTPRNVSVHAVAFVGWAEGYKDTFYEPGNLATLGQWFLENTLLRDDGGTVQIASFSMSFDRAGERGFGPMGKEVLDEVARRATATVDVAPDRDREEAVIKRRP